jgi:hypothetical protein
LIREGYLRADLANGFFWVTAKAERRFGLERVLGMPFPE